MNRFRCQLIPSLPTSFATRPLYSYPSIREHLLARNIFIISRKNIYPRKTQATVSKASSIFHRKQSHAGQTGLKLVRRAPKYLLSFIFLNAVAAYSHTDDGYFYFYPLPFALDIGSGPSMLPTMDNCQTNLYWRDCWSHRFVWFNLENLQSFISDLISQESVIRSTTLRRPWQRGDVVTIYNPFTKSIVTKRIIGVGGDAVLAFGEYASDFSSKSDARFPVPFCEKLRSERGKTKSMSQSQGPKHATSLIVPPNHIWVEGDNPLCSTDSRHYGPLPETALRGRIIMRLWPIMQVEKNRTNGSALLGSTRPAPLIEDISQNN
ncbi:hypothetical protein ACHAWF_013329 [Thalassiosira exigua]